MSEDGAGTRGAGEGGRFMRWAFRHLAGPAEVAGRGAGRLGRGPRAVEARSGRAQALQPGTARTEAGRPRGRPRLSGRRSAVGVARAPAAHPARALRPGRRRRAVDVQLAHHVVADLAAICWSSEPASSRSWVAQAVDSASTVSSPSSSLTGRLCCGHLRADHPLPGAEDRRLGRRLLPAARLHQPVQHRAERLRVARVGPGPGVAAQPPLEPPAPSPLPPPAGYAGSRAAACRRASAASSTARASSGPATASAPAPRRSGGIRTGSVDSAGPLAPGRRRCAPRIRRYDPRRPAGGGRQSAPLGSGGCGSSDTAHRPLADLRSGHRAGRPARRRPPRR